MTLTELIISFFIYSFIGWIWESVFCGLFFERRLLNRGFFYGPCIPIYGFGALMDILVLSWISHPILLFLLGGILCCLMEYLTSVILEKLFHARWWDYSNMKNQIQGRVCLAGFIAFGLGCVLVNQYVSPLLISLIRQFDPVITLSASIVLLLLFFIDVIITLRGMVSFDTALQKLSAALENAQENVTVLAQKAQNHLPSEKIREIYEKHLGDFTREQLRNIRAFPELVSSHYNQVLKDFRHYLIHFSKKKK